MDGDLRETLGTVSVVVPVLDEEGNVGPLVRDLVRALRPLQLPFEIVAVDDGSRDGTRAELLALGPDVPELVVLALARNVGLSTALGAGLDRARGDVIVTLDGDRQNDPADIPRLLERIAAGADLVSGWRRPRRDPLLSRRLPSALANALVRALTGVPVHDLGCSLKAYRRDVVGRLQLYSDMHRFLAVLAMAAGASIEEIPVTHHPRRRGRSKYGWRRLFEVISDLFVVAMLTRFRERPTRGFAALGMPFLAGAVGCGVAALAVGERSVVLPTVSVILALVFLFCLLGGLLGEAIVATASRADARGLLVRELGGPR